MGLRWFLVGLVACSGGKAKATEDAKHPTVVASDGAGARDAAAPVAAVGDVQIRVEWANVPAAVRNSPGKTACNTPRAPSVAPSTTWGIGDVFVFVEGAPPVATDAWLRFADCVLSPRVELGTTLSIDSAADRPITLSIARRGDVAHLDALAPGTPRVVHLPISGHAVSAPLEAGGLYEVSTDAKEPESAWVVAASAAITDPNGSVLIKDVSVGKRKVSAWLPPRAGQPARHASGEIAVVAGDLAELTLTLIP